MHRGYHHMCLGIPNIMPCRPQHSCGVTYRPARLSLRRGAHGVTNVARYAGRWRYAGRVTQASQCDETGRRRRHPPPRNRLGTGRFRLPVRPAPLDRLGNHGSVPARRRNAAAQPWRGAAVEPARHGWRRAAVSGPHETRCPEMIAWCPGGFKLCCTVFTRISGPASSTGCHFRAWTTF